MEITLEKIELVKDRTGVSYKEAKEALEATDGSVVDAIIGIEESFEETGHAKFGKRGNAAVDKVKDLVNKGNVSRIVVKRDDEIMLNLPLNIGILGTIIAPWGVIAGVLAAFGTKCVIELIKDDGSIIDVSEMAEETFDEVKEKGSNFADEMKAKGNEVYQNVKHKTEEALAKVKKDEDDDDCCCDNGEDCCCDEGDDDCCCDEGDEDCFKSDESDVEEKVAE